MRAPRSRFDPRDGASCAARGLPPQANPYPFETADHYGWLADWCDGRARGVSPTSADFRRLQEMARQYRAQAQVVGSSGMQPGDGR